MSERRFTTPFIIVLVTAAVMIGLGVWQLQRSEWKAAYIVRMNERMHDEAIPLNRAKEMRQNEDIEYTRVTVTGTYLHDQERYLFAHIGGQVGWSVITPLVTAENDVVFVNRGFVPKERKDPATRKEGLIQGPTEVKGVLLLSEPTNWFTPVNNVSGNRWYWRDIPALAASLPPAQAPRVLPFLIESDATPVPGDWPRGGITRMQIPNWHRSYAIAWFVAAAMVLVMYALRRRRRTKTA